MNSKKKLKRWAFMVVSLAGINGAGASHAQDASSGAVPPLSPQKDVTVNYLIRSEGVPRAKPVKVYFSGSKGLLRMDQVEGQGEIIINRDQKLITIVMNNDRLYTQIPQRQEINHPFLLNSSMHFTRTGEKNIAGFTCTLWKVEVPAKGESTVCVTPDGVILEHEGTDSEGVHGQLEAQSVVYGTLPVALFEPPAGYQKHEPPPQRPASSSPAGGNAGE